VRRAGTEEASPQFVFGKKAQEKFPILENGLKFELSFSEGYSVGLFLDQRDNRRRLMKKYIASGFAFPSRSGTEGPLKVLNTFAYTCGFSVCAASVGAHTTSLDLSKKYLEWGKRNFLLNGLDPAQHDFIYGDAFDWVRRLAKKGRMFDVVILDPPTFSQSKEFGVFRVEKDYSQLLRSALPLLKPGGILFASNNGASQTPEQFLEIVRGAVQKCGKVVAQEHYCPQPPDFPISRAEPGYLKSVWMRLDNY
jgi:23S rRNA (cytosine1962-C5)-methyltransferase